MAKENILIKSTDGQLLNAIVLTGKDLPKDDQTLFTLIIKEEDDNDN